MLEISNCISTISFSITIQFYNWSDGDKIGVGTVEYKCIGKLLWFKISHLSICRLLKNVL